VGGGAGFLPSMYEYIYLCIASLGLQKLPNLLVYYVFKKEITFKKVIIKHNLLIFMEFDYDH
jgi:hypothetical protein